MGPAPTGGARRQRQGTRARLPGAAAGPSGCWAGDAEARGWAAVPGWARLLGRARKGEGKGERAAVAREMACGPKPRKGEMIIFTFYFPNKFSQRHFQIFF